MAIKCFFFNFFYFFKLYYFPWNEVELSYIIPNSYPRNRTYDNFMFKKLLSTVWGEILWHLFFQLLFIYGQIINFLQIVTY